MKKLIYLLLLLIFVPMSLFAAITGSGTWASPYTGTISNSSEDFTINGTKYFNTIVVSGGGTLTISAGAILYASATTSSITITDTGILSAVGGASSLITISADNDGSGNHDAGEKWKNLTFDFSTGISVVDYAVIEYGTGNDNYNFGGGILIAANNVTISNSTIRNCSINGSGGGIYMYPTGTAVSLQNVVLHDNSATGNGGGLVIDGGEAAGTITGCDIYHNSASLGAGVYILTSANSTNPTINNSSIYNHTSGSGQGVYNNLAGSSVINCVIYNNKIGIYFNTAGSAVNCDVVNNITGITTTTSSVSKIVNTVLWGNTTQYSVASGILALANCGIQGGLSGGTDGGGNKTLSATNGADTGPNFVDPSSNFHINASVAPLVDGGTTSYSGITAPETDIEGKSRISTLDIGAYEFLYYIWIGTTSTDWSATSNWTGSPSSVPTSITDNKVVIPKGCLNYPTASSLSLSTRSILTIEPGAGLTVSGATSVGSGCTFNLKSDATGTANFISGSSVSGSFNVELFLAGGGSPNYKWHYVTTPIDDYTKTVLTNDINNPYNLLNYREDLANPTREAGWNWHDGYNSTPGFSILQTILGYNVYTATDKTVTFIGTVSAGTDFTNSSISFTSGDAFIRGWNLIGNPFTSAVNANDFILSSKLADKTIYFTKDNGYLYWNTFTHVGTGSYIVPALEGFFVHAISGFGSRQITIPASSRMYSSNSLYKGTQSNSGSKESYSFPYLKLNITDGSAFSDETIIYFFNDATISFDPDYDAYKMFSANQANPQIYSISDNINFALNGLPYPDKITVVPLNIRIGVAKNYTINILNLENLSDCKVTLIHGTNRIDLKANPSYTFSAVAGTITDMSIEFDMSLTTDINVPSKDQTACWYSNGSVFIKTYQNGFENNSSVMIYDVNGRMVYNLSDINLSRGETVEIPVSLANGFYITSVNNKNLKLVKKIIISN